MTLKVADNQYDSDKLGFLFMTGLHQPFCALSLKKHNK